MRFDNFITVTFLPASSFNGLGHHDDDEDPRDCFRDCECDVELRILNAPLRKLTFTLPTPTRIVTKGKRGTERETRWLLARRQKFTCS